MNVLIDTARVRPFLADHGVEPAAVREQLTAPLVASGAHPRTTVLDIDTSMGDGAQLGHTSTLYSGQAVPDGERWHGWGAGDGFGDVLVGAPDDRVSVNFEGRAYLYLGSATGCSPSRQTAAPFRI